jgi:V/A-type H+-transporting ATPase subunit C
LHHRTFNVARALAYMMLRERDLRRLRAIARGRSMRLDGAIIRSALGIGGNRREAS